MSADFTAVISNGLASIKASSAAAAGGLDRAAASMSKLGSAGEKEMAKIGAAIAKMGGPLGDIGGKLFGAAGMSGGMAKLAVVAAAAGIGMRAIASAVEAADRRTQAYLDTVDKLRSSLEAAAAAKDAFNSGSTGTGRKEAIAEGLFPNASKLASDIAKESGVSRDAILDAMVASRSLPQKDRERAVRVAATAASTGEVSAASLVSRMTDRGVMARVGSLNNDDAASFLLASDRGTLTSDGIRDAKATILRSRVMPAASQRANKSINGIESTRSAAEGAAFSSGGTELAARKSLGADLNPAAAAMSKGFSEYMQKRARLEAELQESYKNYFTWMVEKLRHGWNLGLMDPSIREKLKDLDMAEGRAVTGMQGN